jgi:hypothetical protein
METPSPLGRNVNGVFHVFIQALSLWVTISVFMHFTTRSLSSFLLIMRYLQTNRGIGRL